MRYQLIILLFFCYYFHSNAQSNYWQQEIDYSINATFNHDSLRGTESITYHNNSDHSVSEIYIHLFPNALTSNKTQYVRQQIQDGFRGIYFAKENERPSMEIESLTLNKQHISYEFLKSNEFVKVELPENLQPGQSVTLSLGFKSKITRMYSRFGQKNGATYMSFWYPKVCAYTKNGWHLDPYLAHGELFQNFGTYKISIDLPDSLKVIGPGLINHVRKDGWSSYSFFGENVHDFMWVAHTDLVKNTFAYTSQDQRQIEISFFYREENESTWSEAQNYISRILQFYENRVGAYPYDELIIVEGKSGMEYPEITVVDGFSGKFRLEQSLVHEIGHIWFFGALATDQANEMWMDEGLVTYYEFDYLNKHYPNAKIFGLNTDAFDNNFGNDLIALFSMQDFDYNSSRDILYQLLANHDIDQPINSKSGDFTFFNYSFIGYLKASVIIEHLSSKMQGSFDEAIHEYYTAWKFKHPNSRDLLNILNKHYEDSLTWLPYLLNTTDKIDLKPTKQNRKSIISVYNSEFKLPVLTRIDSSEKWVDSTTEVSEFSQIELDPKHTIPEIDRSNNIIIKRDGKLTRDRKLKLSLVGSLDHAKYYEHYFLPAMGFNTTDGYLLGAAIYNDLLQTKKWNYESINLYGFRSSNFNGSFKIGYRFFVPGATIRIQSKVVKYAGYRKLGGSISAINRKKHMRDSPNQKLQLSYFKYDVNRSILPIYKSDYQLIKLTHDLTKSDAINKVSIKTSIESDLVSFTKAYAVPSYQRQYFRNAYFTLRGFIGTMISASSMNPSFNFRTSGSLDYQFEDIFIDRAGYNNALFNRQTNLREGGFRNFVDDSSDRYMLSLNTSVDAPKISIFGVYTSLAYLPSSQFQFEYGAQLRIINDICYVYFPLGGSTYSSGTISGFGDLKQDIRFSIDLNELSFFYQLNKRIGK